MLVVDASWIMVPRMRVGDKTAGHVPCLPAHVNAPLHAPFSLLYMCCAYTSYLYQLLTYYLLIYLLTYLRIPLPCRLNDGMANAHYNLGVAMAEMGRRSEARERYQIAASLEPNTMVRLWLDFT